MLRIQSEASGDITVSIKDSGYQKDKEPFLIQVTQIRPIAQAFSHVPFYAHRLQSRQLWSLSLP